MLKSLLKTHWLTVQSDNSGLNQERYCMQKLAEHQFSITEAGLMSG